VASTAADGSSGATGVTGTTGADSSAVGDSSTGEDAGGGTTEDPGPVTDTGAAGSTGPATFCGDGVIEGIEDCEDGNQDGGDGCGPDCRRDARFVFVSSMQYNVDAITDLELADTLCQGLANDGSGIPAVAKSSTFVAWLSDDLVDAASRIGDSTLPYRRTDLVMVAASKAALLVPDGLDAPIDHDENNTPFALDLEVCGENTVWTGTVAGGFDSTYHCTSWSSSHIASSATTGNTGAANSMWTNQSECSCAAARHLYCFEVG
jgi:cysteine-rich repeat protein